MRNNKAIFAGALMVPALALTGGIAYANTTTGTPAVTRTAVTSTVQPTSNNPAGQAIRCRCDWQRGDHRCEWRGHRYQRPATQHSAYRHRNHHGYQGRNGYGHQGNRGSQSHSYQGQGRYGYGHGYQGGYNGNYCGDGCGW